jgi:hypothetical protein
MPTFNQGNCLVRKPPTMEFQRFSTTMKGLSHPLVGGFNPSEKYESQLGL